MTHERTSWQTLSNLKFSVLWKILLKNGKTSQQLGENISNYVSNKGIKFRIHKELSKLNNKTTKIQFNSGKRSKQVLAKKKRKIYDVK